MTVALPEDGEGQAARPPTAPFDLSWANVVAIGPGLGQRGRVADVVAEVLAGFTGPVVVDADGLNTVAPRGGAVWSTRAGRATVITPHPGEMARLRAGLGLPATPDDDDETRLRIAHEFVTQTGVTVVLKGHRTVVCARDQAYVNTTGNAGMATGGMGDVLTGLIAALLAQGLSAFDAARLGVYAHGLAADQCAREIGAVGFLARDVAEAVPRALQEASRPRIGFR
jgi:NAD(P)H-hydrate epimerase